MERQGNSESLAMHAFQKNWPRGLISKFEPLASNQRMAEVSTGCLPGGGGGSKKVPKLQTTFRIGEV